MNEQEQLQADLDQCREVEKWVPDAIAELQARVVAATLVTVAGAHPTVFLKRLAAELRGFTGELESKADAWIERADVPQGRSS